MIRWAHWSVFEFVVLLSNLCTNEAESIGVGFAFTLKRLDTIWPLASDNPESHLLAALSVVVMNGHGEPFGSQIFRVASDTD